MDAGSLSFILSVGIALFVIWSLSLWQVFNKAGFEGWKSLIPIYNLYILSKIGSQPIWVFLMSLLPIVGFIGNILICISVAKSFGKGLLFGVVGLFIFSFFGYMYIGWGRAEYSRIEV